MAEIGNTVTMDCSLCIACCYGGAWIMPAHGDDPDDYDTDTIGDLTRTKLDPNGLCMYADPEVGCTIYENRPAQCRAFDCREAAADPALEGVIDPLVVVASVALISMTAEVEGAEGGQ